MIAHDFIADGQAVGSDDQGDDDLHAVGALVAAVTEGFEAAGFGDRAVGIDFKVGARQIIEQDVIGYAEESKPAVLEVAEEGLAMI